jgi:D-aminopeptidase
MHHRAIILAGAHVALILGCAVAEAQENRRQRASDLGISGLIGGVAGPLNAITDVAGIEVGHTTIIRGSGKLVRGEGPVRTGVTLVYPRGKDSADPVFGGWFSLNGNGEMTGTTWLQEGGILEGAIAITNTHSVGVVRDAMLQWNASRPGLQPWGLPLAAETYDGGLNDINGFHVKPEHVWSAIESARGGAVEEGNVGGGTGMICHGFKGGIGTSSRRVSAARGGYTVGVLVQCNYGARGELSVAGVPVGEEISDLLPCVANRDTTILPGRQRCAGYAGRPGAAQTAGVAATTGGDREDVDAGGTGGSLGELGDAGIDGAGDAGTGEGSIIIIVATDAPLLPHQLRRLAVRASLGVARMGGKAENGSGDIFIAFSTANPRTSADTGTARLEMLPNARMNPLFYATVQATEEAIVNALLAAGTMTGANDLRVHAIPVDRMMDAMRKYNRLR